MKNEWSKYEIIVFLTEVIKIFCNYSTTNIFQDSFLNIKEFRWLIA